MGKMDKLEKSITELTKTVLAMKVDFVQAMKDEDRYTRDLLMQEIRASEHRTKTELRGEFRKDLAESEKRILDGVGDALDRQVLSQIDDYDARLIKLEEKYG